MSLKSMRSNLDRSVEVHFRAVLTDDSPESFPVVLFPIEREKQHPALRRQTPYDNAYKPLEVIKADPQLDFHVLNPTATKFEPTSGLVKFNMINANDYFIGCLYFKHLGVIKFDHWFLAIFASPEIRTHL